SLRAVRLDSYVTPAAHTSWLWTGASTTEPAGTAPLAGASSEPAASSWSIVVPADSSSLRPLQTSPRASPPPWAVLSREIAIALRAHRDRVRGRVQLARRLALLARAEARLALAAERGVEVDAGGRHVDADHAGLQPVDDGQRGVEVLREDRRDEA